MYSSEKKKVYIGQNFRIGGWGWVKITKWIRDGPFNFQGGYGFFSKKIFWFPMLLKKNSDFGGGKKNNLIQSFCHIT